jgi:threonine/homoserine/homoserine lactone efflux protein
MTLHQLATFAVAAFLIIVVPGPSVLFVISRGVALGRRAALATVMGNTAGAATAALLVAAGLGPLLSRSVVLFTVLKVVGACYLVYLGLSAIRHRRRLSEALIGDAAPVSLRRIVADGFVVGITNPKVFVFFAAVLPQYVNPEGGPAAIQMAVFALLFALIALASDSVWGLAAGSASAWFGRSPRRLEAIGGIGGLAIVGLGLRVAFTGRKD